MVPDKPAPRRPSHPTNLAASPQPTRQASPAPAMRHITPDRSTRQSCPHTSRTTIHLCPAAPDTPFRTTAGPMPTTHTNAYRPTQPTRPTCLPLPSRPSIDHVRRSIPAQSTCPTCVTRDPTSPREPLATRTQPNRHTHPVPARPPDKPSRARPPSLQTIRPASAARRQVRAARFPALPPRALIGRHDPCRTPATPAANDPASSRINKQAGRPGRNTPDKPCPFPPPRTTCHPRATPTDAPVRHFVPTHPSTAADYPTHSRPRATSHYSAARYDNP
jgi:hypothetical protein